MAQLTLIVDASVIGPLSVPDALTVRAPRVSDTDRLGQLYFDCRVPGADLTSSAEAIDEVRSFFSGDFGEYWPDASGLIEDNGTFLAALLAVHRAPWDDTPDCPFVTDLFVEPGSRQRGLARALLARCLAAAGRTDRPWVALRADSDNAPAMQLYRSLGFRHDHPNRR